MASVLANHPDISSNEVSFLTIASNVGDTTLNLQNSQGFSQSQWVVVGKLGDEQAEIQQINAPVTVNNQLTVTALKFPHGLDTPVTVINFNQARFYSGVSSLGPFTLLITLPITPDRSDGTLYYDTTGTANTWYKTTLYNSQSGIETDINASVPVQPTGYTIASLRKLQDRVIALFNDNREQFLIRVEVTDWLNEGYEIFQNAMYGNNEAYGVKFKPLSTSISTTEYQLPDDFKIAQKVQVSFDGTTFYEAFPLSITEDEPRQIYTKSVPAYFFDGPNIGIRPTPDSNSGIINLWYYPIALSLSNDNDALIPPISGYTRAIVYYGLAKGKAKDSKPDQHDEFMALFERELQRFRMEIYDRQMHKAAGVTMDDTGYLDSLYPEWYAGV
jgi:hypothetical protein